jgi:hypothetical protein
MMILTQISSGAWGPDLQSQQLQGEPSAGGPSTSWAAGGFICIELEGTR